MTVVYNWELKQMDVKTVFLHGTLEETIYMNQPMGLVDKQKPNHLCLLKRSIYGPKQSPRQWNRRFDSSMISLGFKRSKYDTCLYHKFSKKNPLYVLLYVDDILLISSLKSAIVEVKNDLKKFLDMKDFGPAQKILGIKITRDRNKKVMCLS